MRICPYCKYNLIENSVHILVEVYFHIKYICRVSMSGMKFLPLTVQEKNEKDWMTVEKVAYASLNN